MLSKRRARGKAQPILETQLEELLRAAKDGEITGIAGLAILTDGSVRYLVTGSAFSSPAVTLELVSRLKGKVADMVIR